MLDRIINNAIRSAAKVNQWHKKLGKLSSYKEANHPNIPIAWVKDNYAHKPEKTSFLDATLDLDTGTYKPFIKPMDNPIYINVQTNHSLYIIKHIPYAVGKRISMLSSNEEIFKTATPKRNVVLKTSGYSDNITYSK